MLKSPSTEAAGTPRASLGAIFLIVFIDLAGFSIIFPLFPAMLQYYLPLDGGDGLLSQIVFQLERFAAGGGSIGESVAVHALFGGVLGSLYSILQFLFSPVWGRLSDNIGRRRVLLLTISGTALSYLLWAFSGQFWILVVARLFGGAMAGNISVATAAVADITGARERSKGMAVIGVAFAVGFIVGPAIGGISSFVDLRQWLDWLPGINPFSLPALLAMVLAILNLFWVYKRLPETLAADKRRPRPLFQSPLGRLRGSEGAAARRVLQVNFLFLVAFSGMEFTLTFLALERLGFGPAQNASMFVFIGIVLIFVQGYFVRRFAQPVGEKKMAGMGLVLGLMGLAVLGMADTSVWFFLGLFLMACGIGVTSPTLTTLVSLYNPESQQGTAMGAFRSVGSLARACGPFLGALLFWWLGSRNAYIIGGAFLVLPLLLCLLLPQPETEQQPAAQG